MKRHELWELKYRNDRYMEFLSMKELDARFGDVISNSTTLADNGKLSMEVPPEWLKKSAHLFEEYRLRGSNVPPVATIQENLVMPQPKGLQLALAVKNHFPDGFPTDFTLFKYGKMKYLAPLLDEGHLRLSPASYYADPSLNLSIKDDKLNFTKISKNKRVKYTSDTDYYCFCSSWMPNNRIVADFDANCVIVVENPHEFFLRLRTSFKKIDWVASFNKVTYIDPLLMGEDHIESITFTKHFRYEYQFEHRFIIFPPTHQKKLKHVDLVLGSIGDIATIYKMN